MSNVVPVIKKVFWFEFIFWIKRIRVFKSLLLFISFLELLIVGYSDIKSSLFGDEGLISNELINFGQHEKGVIILILVIFFMLSWLADNAQKKNEIKDLSIAISEHVIQNVNKDLTELVSSLKQKFSLSNDVRASIWLPLRENSFSWGLHMMCRAENVSRNEQNASFNLDEGVLGHTFITATNDIYVGCLDVSNSSALPQAYTHLSQSNKLFIENNIKGVAVLYLKRKGHTEALLAIDTTNESDVMVLQGKPLHSEITNWMLTQLKTTDLIWRDYH